MSLRDPDRAGQVFAVDEAVARVLRRWSKKSGAEADATLRRAMAELSRAQQSQLLLRLSEISLGRLRVIQYIQERGDPIQDR